MKRISQRDIKEHTELLGSPQVQIEPYSSMVNDAVAIVNSKQPELLKNISDIKINLNKNVYGEFETSNPNTIWINIGKIEGEVRSKLQGKPEEEIKKEIIKQVSSTIIHEGTHKKEYKETGQTTESKPEQAEKQFMESIE